MVGPLVCPALGQWCGTHTYLGVGIPGLPRVRPVVPVWLPPREGECRACSRQRRAPPVATRQSAAVRVRVRDNNAV